jgi:hypothetical protein
MSRRRPPAELGTWRAGPVWESCAFCDRSEDKDGSAVCRYHRRLYNLHDRPARRRREERDG